MNISPEYFEKGQRYKVIFKNGEVATGYFVGFVRVNKVLHLEFSKNLGSIDVTIFETVAAMEEVECLTPNSR